MYEENHDFVSGFSLSASLSAILVSMHIIEEIEQHEEEVVNVAFHIGMWWRIFYGAMRLALGVVMLKFFIGIPFSELLYDVMSHEVTEDPTDALFQFVYILLQDHSFTVTYFVALYLIFWGIIDVVLSVCLLKRKLWAFPVSIGLIGLFVFYSIYRFFHTHSLVLLGVICIDMLVLYVIHREYRLLKSETIPGSPVSPKVS